MSTITNARRIKDVLEAFRKDTGDLPDLGRDPPVLYSSEHVDHVRGFRHYGKGSLDRISQAVEQRAVRIFQEAIATSGVFS